MNKIVFILLFFISSVSFSQSTPISNIVNSYAEITGFRTCDNSLQVNGADSFHVGDYVLIIQMKGATVDDANTKHFGHVMDYHNAGNYEFNTVKGIAGDHILLQNILANQYDIPDGAVQLVRVANYISANIVGTLTCAPWDGKKGGVLAVIARDQLTFNGNIDVTGKGFRGGSRSMNHDTICGSGNLDYAYTVSSGLGAEKGEGICKADPSKDGGMGAWANGGGGGNKENAGGGGGSNFTQGGKGGNQAGMCTAAPIGGEGAQPLDYKQDKIFLGGGGGCSDNNDNVGTPGSSGGGIVILQTKHITGDDYAIISNGANVPVIENGVGDGAGGGGAGGTVFLTYDGISGDLKVVVNGGNGGDINTSVNKCFGPGGGGGIGVVLLPTRKINGLAISTNPGYPGRGLNPKGPCYNYSYGAISGNLGKGIVFNKQLNKPAKPFIGNLNIATSISKFDKETVTLNARGGSSYSWSPATNLSSSNGQASITSSPKNIIYTVKINDDLTGCFNVDTFKITIKDSVPVAKVVPVKKDTVVVVVPKPVIPKDTVAVVSKPIVKKDTVVAVVPKPAVPKEVVPVIIPKPVVPVRKDTIPVVAKVIPVKKDTVVAVVVKPTLPKQDTVPVLPKITPPKKDSVLVTRKPKVESIIKVSGDTLTLAFYDDGIVDGDSISLYINKKLIFEHVMLKTRPYIQKIALASLPAECDLVMVAENLGTIPPNTAYIQATSNSKTAEIYLSSDLNENAVMRLIKE